jgi:hypothetical protein
VAIDSFGNRHLYTLPKPNSNAIIELETLVFFLAWIIPAPLHATTSIILETRCA